MQWSQDLQNPWDNSSMCWVCLFIVGHQHPGGILVRRWWSSGPSQMTELLTLALTEALAATTHPWPAVGSVNQLRATTSNLEVPILIAATWLHPEILSIKFWSESVKKRKSNTYREWVQPITGNEDQWIQTNNFPALRQQCLNTHSVWIMTLV